MPIRIKPTQEFKPCVITLDSIKEMISLIENEFDSITFSATDGIWEIYDEPKEGFLNHISQRETLDSLKMLGITTQDNSEIEIVFDESSAFAKFIAPPSKDRWFQHFLGDIKNHLLRATFAQTLIYSFNVSDVYFRLPLLLFAVPVRFNNLSVPYCNIIIQKQPPNPFIENIKANLVSSVIWVVLTVLLTLFAQWVLSNFGIDLTPWD